MTAPFPIAEAGVSIGAVLEWLRPEFPDISISKIRFLESEGLVSPERTATGYRRFSAADIERISRILELQRDSYLPLKVIREQLDGEGAQAAALRPRAVPQPGSIGAADLLPEREIRVTREDLLARAGIDAATLAELVKAGLIAPGAFGFFNAEAVAIAVIVGQLLEFGLEVRHLRPFKQAAEREAGLAAQLIIPVAKGRDDAARGRAEERAREFGALSASLHTALVKVALNSALE
jgi:DNA-binding transcriptional MerR regulator